MRAASTTTHAPGNSLQPAPLLFSSLFHASSPIHELASITSSLLSCSWNPYWRKRWRRWDSRQQTTARARARAGEAAIITMLELSRSGGGESSPVVAVKESAGACPDSTLSSPDSKVSNINFCLSRCLISLFKDTARFAAQKVGVESRGKSCN